MCRSIKPLIATLFLFFFTSVVAFANTTNDEIFEKAIQAYDKTIKATEKIKGKDDDSKSKEGQNAKITPEQYKEIKTQLDNTYELFEQYLRIGNDTYKKNAARFYSLVLKKIDLQCLNDLGKINEAYRMVSGLDQELTSVKSMSFPINYKSGSKNYVVKYDQKKSLETSLLIEFTKACSNNSKHTEAAAFAKKAYALYSYGDYNFWWAAHMRFYHNSKNYENGEEMVESSEKLVYAMSGLKRSDIKMIKDSNWANYTHAYQKLNSLLSSKPELSRNGEVWAKTGEYFERLDESKWAMEYYKKALKAGYGDKTFLNSMMSKGKSKKDVELVKSAVEIYDSKNLYSSWDCYDYNTIADYFEYIGNTTKASELRTKYKECQKAKNKADRKRERGGKFYVSFAPLALISGNIQASVQLGGNRRLHEFGFKQTNSQRDYGWDISDAKDRPKDFRWSGMGYYYTYKRMTKGGNDKTSFYTGIQLRYTQRAYDDVQTTLYNTQTKAYTQSTFQPKESRYDFTYQVGAIVSTRFIHFDYYFGMGLGYSVFDGGNQFWNDGQYEITNHDILSRRKETRVGVTFRLGFMMGLNFINKGY